MSSALARTRSAVARADPGPADLEFLTAMADQAATAVDYAALLTSRTQAALVAISEGLVPVPRSATPTPTGKR